MNAFTHQRECTHKILSSTHSVSRPTEATGQTQELWIEGNRDEPSTYYVPVPVEDAFPVSSLSHHAHQTPYGPAQPEEAWVEQACAV